MTFREAARSGLTKYAVFTGRAGRSEFWYYLIYLYIQPSGGPNEFDTPAAAE